MRAKRLIATRLCLPHPGGRTAIVRIWDATRTGEAATSEPPLKPYPSCAVWRHTGQRPAQSELDKAACDRLRAWRSRDMEQPIDGHYGPGTLQEVAIARIAATSSRHGSEGGGVTRACIEPAGIFEFTTRIVPEKLRCADRPIVTRNGATGCSSSCK